MPLHRFSTLREAEEFFTFYQRETVTAWRVYCVDKRLAKTGTIRELQNNKIRVQWSLTVGKGVSVEFDGIPFVFVGAKRWMCHMGKDVDIRKKEKLRALSQQRRLVDASFRPRQKWQSSKKIDCPAMAYLTHIIKFPGYELMMDDMDKIRAKRQVAVTLRHDILSEKEMQIQHQYIIKVPECNSHVGHMTREVDISPRSSLKYEIAHAGSYSSDRLSKGDESDSQLDSGDQKILVEVLNGPKRPRKRTLKQIVVKPKKRRHIQRLSTYRYRCVTKWKAIQDDVYRIDNEDVLIDFEESLNKLHENLLKKEIEAHCSNPVTVEVQQTMADEESGLLSANAMFIT
ncbi:uncharacterized protein LOC143446928 [Clavelina lepadiformis]|uniref:Uncharacterized protein n=1 Tax=Clavelina lepadiformis TaxID=159417 RepID=A0ABP0GU26_CLALP